jgi:hypothetical protein
MAADPFSRHRGAEPDRPKPDRTAPPQPERTREPSPAQELLIWIKRHWGKPVISLRDIQAYGPNAIRARKTAIAQAEILVEYGWLVPTKPHRRDRIVWIAPPITRPLPR